MSHLVFPFFPSKWVDKKASLIHCLTLCYPPSSIYCTHTAPWKERKDTDRISNTAGAWTPETVKKCEHRSEVTLSCLVGLSLFCVPCSIAFAACVFKWIYLPSLHLKMMKSCIMHVGWKTQLPLCAAHKRMGMTRSSKHLFMSDYNSQTWKCVFFFPHLPPLLLPFFFLPLIWFREQCETHCCSSVYCNYYRSHCLTLKGCVQVVELN